MLQEKYRQNKGEGAEKENQEGRRRRMRKSVVDSPSTTTTTTTKASSHSYHEITGKPGKKSRRESKLASEKREQECRGSRTRRRANGGSLSSRGSAATGMQCGLCAILASLFRRAMCIAGSRRGSGESCYQELATEMHPGQQQQLSLRLNPTIPGSPVKLSRSASFGSTNRLNDSLQRERGTEITVDSSGQNAVFVRLSEDASLPMSGTTPAMSTCGSQSPTGETEIPSDVRPRLFSEQDRLLLENLNNKSFTIRHNGRFLTMHKRRRKRLITRSLKDHALLDDIFHGQVQCVLQRAGNWKFNAFTLETVTGGRSLPVLCVHLFQFYGLLKIFNLDVVRVWKLFALIEEGYHSTNPYHNSIHATDVTQAMHCFLQEEKIKRYLSSLEIMASLIAAVTHDLDHPGVNQPFLVATSNHLATLYENTSVLENHHWRSAIGCLLESGVSDELPPEIRPELQRHISSLILATDITRQQEFLTRFKTCLDQSSLNMEYPENRHFILQISLKCADISNPCRPWDISRKWSYKVCEEFFRQGDYERQLNLPVTPLCDRQSISIPRIQTGFFEFVVTPLYEEWHRFLGDGLSVSLMAHLRGNQKRWEALVAHEVAEETRTEMSDLEQPQDNCSTSEGEDEEEEKEPMTTTEMGEDSRNVEISLSETVTPNAISESVSSFRRPSLPGDIGPRRINKRRHSVPLSVVSKESSLLPSIEDTRRESMPDEVSKHSRCPIFRLDEAEFVDEALREMSSLSLLSSSRSSVYESAGNASLSCERPVSAENLLPETSIASITSDPAAARLTSVLQPDFVKSGTQTKHLTRQQTFPPLQPYVRIRYMSTTAEMSKYQAETLIEADDSLSSSEHTPTTEKSPGQVSEETDCDSPRQQQCSNPETGSSILRDNRSSRKRDFAFSELTRHTLDVFSTFGKDLPRRHSVQAVRSEEQSLSGFKNRHRRPSSAQEAYPAQMLYASITGGAKPTSYPVSSESRTDNEIASSQSPQSIDATTNSPHKRYSVSSSIIASDKGPALSVLDEKSIESELRRHSTLNTDSRTLTSANNSSVRRFTAIPVTSELPTRKFFIGSPPGSPPRFHSVSSSSESGSDHRHTDSDCSRQNSCKIAKLNDDQKMKENLDPRTIDDLNKSNVAFGKRSNQGWARRRGSAPVGLLSKLDDCPNNTSVIVPKTDRCSTRRGSVPTDTIIDYQVSGTSRAALGPRGENVPLPRRASLPQDATISHFLGNTFSPTEERENFPTNNNNNNNGGHTGTNNNGSCRISEGIGVSSSMTSPRRGSVPADISELRRDLFGRNSVNGKTRNRKKTLKRRSSGGPEMFSGRSVDDNDNGKLTGWKREMAKRDSIPEPSVKRRGSLPVEMVPIFHPGSTTGVRRSSLWRL